VTDLNDGAASGRRSSVGRTRISVAHISVSPFGLSGAEFARVFDVSERTVRGWEAGRRDRNSEPVVVPRPIAVLVRLALKHASVRRELGIPSKQ
jgi:hypothetical protein